MSTSPTPFTFDGHGINDANGERIIKVQFPRYDQNGENLEFVRLSTMIAAMPQMARAITIALVALNTINPETGNRIHQDAGLTNISNALSAVAGLMIGENNVADAQHWLNQAERVPVIPTITQALLPVHPMKGDYVQLLDAEGRPSENHTRDQSWTRIPISWAPEDVKPAFFITDPQGESYAVMRLPEFDNDERLAWRQVILSS